MTASFPKVKYPMDMTRAELDALTAAAEERHTNKKALIYSALKKAYNIDLESANSATAGQTHTGTE